jgi:hypothetical protein
LPARKFEFPIREQIFHCLILDPTRGRFPPPDSTPIPRPQEVHIRPLPPEFQEDRDENSENPIVLAMESPAIRLVRWIITCNRGEETGKDIIQFIRMYHHMVINGWKDEDKSSFRWSFRKCVDLITGFHFLSTKEEIFVLESRLDDRKHATFELNKFLRYFSKDIHILGDTSISFPAPRKYCCLDRLVKRIEIPISLDELLQIHGLYFHSSPNHRLFSIAKKLHDLLQCQTLIEAEERNAFPNYQELKGLLKRAIGLFAMPLLDGPRTIVRKIVEKGDFADQTESDPFVIHRSSCYVPIGEVPIIAEAPERERLTNFVLTRPQIKVHRTRVPSEGEETKTARRNNEDVRRRKKN